MSRFAAVNVTVFFDVSTVTPLVFFTPLSVNNVSVAVPFNDQPRLELFLLFILTADKPAVSFNVIESVSTVTIMSEPLLVVEKVPEPLPIYNVEFVLKP